MNVDARRRLGHARDACEAIELFIRGRSFAEYEADLMLRSAVERQFEIVGEALHHAGIDDETVVDLVPDLRSIVGLRNRIIHGYDAVDNEIIWRAIHDNLPALEVQLAGALA